MPPSHILRCPARRDLPLDAGRAIALCGAVWGKRYLISRPIPAVFILIATVAVAFGRIAEANAADLAVAINWRSGNLFDPIDLDGPRSSPAGGTGATRPPPRYLPTIPMR